MNKVILKHALYESFVHSHYDKEQSFFDTIIKVHRGQIILKKRTSDVKSKY